MAQKLRILQLVTKRQYRGAEVFAANLSKELIDLGHEIIFVGLYKNDKDILEVKKARNIDVSNSKRSKFSLKIVLKLYSLIKEIKPDVIQCNGSDTLKYSIAATLGISKIPVVYRNISTISEWIKSPHQKLLYELLLKKVDHITSVGENARQDLIKTFKYPEEKITVIRRGIPLREVKGSAVHRLREELDLAESDNIVMHVGNFSPEKNHRFLIDIFKRIKTVNPNIKLVCVGAGLLFEEIKEEIEKSNLERTVFLLGFRRNAPELLAASDLCVLCSKIEGVPGVVLEAAAQKKPTVSVDVGGIKEVLLNNRTGKIVEDYNMEDFVRNIISLIENVDLRRKLGENAYNLVLEEFNPSKNALKFEELYSSLLR